jgi:spore coat polysaccharide biosynthesis predicted glycosyltransferase SpsG
MSKSKNVIFRCDGNSEIGMGHIIGSIRLARLLKKELSLEPIFLTRANDNICNYLDSNDFQYSTIPSSANVELQIQKILQLHENYRSDIVVFNFNAEELELWGDKFKILKDEGLKIVFQDNPMQSFLFGDVVINALPHPEYKGYNSFEHPACFDGLKYMLFDDALYHLEKKIEKKIEKKPGKIDRILVAMGGGDSENISSTILRMLSEIGCRAEIDVVLGAACPHMDEVNDIIIKSSLKAKLSINISDMASRIYHADLGFSAIGLTTYEMAALKLPCFIITPHALNAKVAKVYERDYLMAKYGGMISNIKMDDLRKQIKIFISDSTFHHNVRNTQINFEYFGNYKKILSIIESTLIT